MKNVLSYFVIQVTHNLPKRLNLNLFEFTNQMTIFNDLSAFKQSNQSISFELMNCCSEFYKLIYEQFRYIWKPAI